MYRIGHGFDVHKLVEGRRFMLGGVNIPWHRGAFGHSDADALLHAICDALLGAASMGDIGWHFPDNDNKYKDINSSELLHQVSGMVKAQGYEVGNIDCTVALQEPKIAGYIPEMQKIIARILGKAEEDISIKATTTEHLGFTGRGEGIAVWAVALLYDGK
jgi:2-C-methyl-D-erythritol 2,4-cyclodiphosphate synthase